MPSRPLSRSIYPCSLESRQNLINLIRCPIFMFPFLFLCITLAAQKKKKSYSQHPKSPWRTQQATSSRLPRPRPPPSPSPQRSTCRRVGPSRGVRLGCGVATLQPGTLRTCSRERGRSSPRRHLKETNFKRKYSARSAASRPHASLCVLAHSAKTREETAVLPARCSRSLTFL